MRENREFQGRREQLQVLRGVSQVHVVNAPRLNFQWRLYGARHIRPDIVLPRAFPEERRNFTWKGEGEKTHSESSAACPQQTEGDFTADRACTYVNKTCKKMRGAVQRQTSNHPLLPFFAETPCNGRGIPGQVGSDSN